MQVVLPTSFFPSIAYMQQIASAARVMIDIQENYVKQNLRNRCEIFSPNGKLDLIVPVVKGRSPQTPTSTIRISYQEDWQIRHWRSIEAAYRSSPYFEFYEDEIKAFFTKEYEFLYEYNRAILREIMQLVGLQKNIEYSTEYIEGNEWLDKRELCAKKRPELESPKTYFQVFQDKHGFLSNLSILDLLFCEGPNSLNILS